MMDLGDFEKRIQEKEKELETIKATKPELYALLSSALKRLRKGDVNKEYTDALLARTKELGGIDNQAYSNFTDYSNRINNVTNN